MNRVQKRNVDVPPCHECPMKVNSMFCDLQEQELKFISETKTSNVYKKGQAIFSEDRTPHGVYCIYTGKVKIHKDGENGKEQILRFARPGQIIGYRALLSGEKYMASATAMETSLVCYFPKQTFMTVLQTNPAFSLKIIHQLAADLKVAEQHLISMAHKVAHSRMAEALIMLHECYGSEPQSSLLLAKPSRRELANIAGTTTETAIRIIGELRDKGMISFDGKRIGIMQLDKLRMMAQSF